MSLSTGRTWHILLIFCLAVALSACGGTPTPQAEPATAIPTVTASAVAPTATPTATFTPTPPAEPQAPPTATRTPAEPQPPPTATHTPAPASACHGLAGELEIQILVGPAEAVGLEPVAVGRVPFAVTTSSPPYLVEGQGPISYEATLEREWGTYAVTMDMETTVQGECSGQAGSEQLDLVLEMTGEQLVVVTAEGFSREYPWSGTQSLDLAFPLQDGATAGGEGWTVVLHLDSP